LEAVKFSRLGYSILLIGNPQHDEVLGTLAEAPEVTEVLSNLDDAERIEVQNRDRVACLKQTSLGRYEAAEIMDILKHRFPTIKSPLWR
jgi:4-hydroxy-3-methylbut-2-en-1-yl diphosphate reductase